MIFSAKSIQGIVEGEEIHIGSMNICGTQQESDKMIFVGSQDRLGQLGVSILDEHKGER